LLVASRIVAEGYPDALCCFPTKRATMGLMTRSAETTWERSAPSQIVLNSIFAALDGALIVIIIQDPAASSGHHLCSLALLVVSFALFAVSAEKCVVALEERDVKKYAYYMLPYNLGVILGGAAIEILIYSRFDGKLQGWVSPYAGGCSRWVSLICWLLVAVVLMWTWIHDVYWLFASGRKDYEVWLEELEDKHNPQQDHSRLMKMFYGLRGALHR
jgi:hypothetical protein